MRLTTSLLLVFVGLPGAIQAQVGREALEGIKKGPKVTVSVSQRSNAVTAPLDVYVQITNLTDTDVYIKKIEVLMPGEFVSVRADSKWTNPSSELTDQHLKPGYQRLVPFSISHHPVSLFSSLFNRRLLAFVPAVYDLRVVVTYQVPPEPASQATEVTKITLEPALSSLIWGGVLGAILLAVFVSVYRYVRPFPQNQPSVRKSIKEAVVIASGGAISAVIALLLLQRLKGLELPVNITITDFYGGLVLGLFSYKIGDWLYGQLSADRSSNPNNPVTPGRNQSGQP